MSGQVGGGPARSAASRSPKDNVKPGKVVRQAAQVLADLGRAVLRPPRAGDAPRSERAHPPPSTRSDDPGAAGLHTARRRPSVVDDGPLTVSADDDEVVDQVAR